MDTSRHYNNKLITYRPYTHENFERIPQLGKLSPQQRTELTVTSRILPFKTNNYVINELINWDNPLDDPLFRLTFPQKEMLDERDYYAMNMLLDRGAPVGAVEILAHQIREKMIPRQKIQFLNPWHQPSANKLVFYPAQAQTCHAYCTFCFRWPQFAGVIHLGALQNEPVWLAQYLAEQEDIHELEITGGDPLLMPSAVLARYLEPLVDPGRGNLHTIVLLTKSLSYWPYRFTLDKDAPALIVLFEKIVRSGIKLVIKAHFTHPIELSTRAVSLAIQCILNTGAEIRTQAPVVRNINDDSAVWTELWKKQMEMGCTPQYMLVSQPVGLQQYFAVPLAKVLQTHQEAARANGNRALASGGPIIQCAAGKIRIQEHAEDENLLELELIEARKKTWEGQQFTAVKDENATWISDLKPAGGQGFFFEEELDETFGDSIRQAQADRLE
jgi:L-lysine 2,3-aminomutase